VRQEGKKYQTERREEWKNHIRDIQKKNLKRKRNKQVCQTKWNKKIEKRKASIGRRWTKGWTEQIK
jgi:hypothetical protein